jgi:hypothetical protein
MDCDDVNRLKSFGQNPVMSLIYGSYKSSSYLTTKKGKTVPAKGRGGP